MQTTGDSGLMMLQRDGHLRVMSRREQCQDGSRNQNQNLQALWPDRNATVTFGEETSRLHEQALGISTSYFTSGGIFPPHRASSHVGGEWLPCRRWNTEATSQKFLSIGLERRFNRNQHCPLFQRTGFKSQHPAEGKATYTALGTHSCNSNPRGSNALF